MRKNQATSGYLSHLPRFFASSLFVLSVWSLPATVVRAEVGQLNDPVTPVCQAVNAQLTQSSLSDISEAQMALARNISRRLTRLSRGRITGIKNRRLLRPTIAQNKALISSVPSLSYMDCVTSSACITHDNGPVLRKFDENSLKAYNRIEKLLDFADDLNMRGRVRTPLKVYNQELLHQARAGLQNIPVTATLCP